MGRNLTRFERAILFFAIGLATFMIVLDYSIANVSIPYIAGDISVSVDEGTYVITSFAVGSAIGLAMTGILTKRVGEIRLFLVAILLFTLTSWLCGISYNLELLVINRFLQGFVSGPLIPLSQSLIIKMGTEESRAKDLAIWTTIVIAAPVIGPILGGYISDWYHWAWIFFINIPIGIFSVLIVWALLRDEPDPVEKVPFDIMGIVLLTIGVTCLQVLLDKGQQWDWLNSNLIWILIAGTVISFTYLIIYELGQDKPFLELRLFRIPTFSLSIISLFVSYAIYFGTIVTVPLWLQEYMGYNAEWAGITVAFLGVGPFFCAAFIPMMIKKMGNMWTLILGIAIFAGACFYNAYFTTQVDWEHVAFSRFFFGLGLAVYFNPLLAISIQGIPQEKLPMATGIFHFVRAMAGGIGTAVFTTLWIRRTYYHHARVGEALTPFNPTTPEIHTDQGLALLNRSLDVQSAMLAINDSFYLMAWLFIGLIILLTLARLTTIKA